jgi:hypothetical protein
MTWYVYLFLFGLNSKQEVQSLETVNFQILKGSVDMHDTQTRRITQKPILSLSTWLKVETNACFQDGVIAAIDYRRKRVMINQRIQLIIL